MSKPIPYTMKCQEHSECTAVTNIVEVAKDNRFESADMPSGLMMADCNGTLVRVRIVSHETRA